MGYGLAVAGTPLAAILRWALVAAAGPMSPYLTFYPVVMFSAMIGGTGPGLLATALSALAVNWLFMAPAGLGFVSAADAVSLGLFCAINVALSIVAGQRLAARRQARAQARDLGQLVQLLDLASVLARDLDDRIVHWTAGCQQLYGYSREQAVGQVTHTLLRTRFPEPLETIRATLFEMGRWEGELSHTAADGRQIMVVSEWVLWRSGTGKPTAILESNTDITERKRAEEASRESEERFRTLADNIPQLAWMADEKGGSFWYNRRWYDYTGTSPKEMEDWGWQKVHHPDHVQRVVDKFRHQVEAGATWEDTFPLRGKDGQYRWFLSRAVPIRDDSGKILRWFGTNTDVTKRLEVEQALRELNETLEQRVAERTADAERRAEQLRGLVSELARAEQHERSRVAGMLHDHLQQLLVGAKFGTTVLSRQLGDDSQREALRKVDELLNKSLETSRNLTTELSPPILKEGTLAAALHWLANWMHDKHGLHVHLKTDETLNPPDEGVRILLFESVRELLFNIVKHAGTDSACATLERCNGDHLRIIVADSGAGFDAGRHDPDGHTRGGFGLFSIRERLGLVGGRFEIESVPGKGTQMTLVAPLRSPSAEPAAQALIALPSTRAEAAPALPEAPIHRPVTSGERIRVLVADDHAVVRDGLAQLLRMHADVEVVGLASDGQHAVELAVHLRPDVILMDVSMPRLNGIDATRRVRSELPDVCVIGLSVSGRPE